MVTDEDVRNMIGRIESGQAEEDEIIEFLRMLIKPRAIKVRKQKESEK